VHVAIHYIKRIAMFNNNVPAQENTMNRRQLLADGAGGILGLSALVGVGYSFVRFAEQSHERVEKLTPGQRDYLWQVVDAGLSWGRPQSKRSSEERLMATHLDGASIFLSRYHINGFGANYRVDIIRADKGFTLICNERHGGREDLALMRTLFDSAGMAPRAEKSTRLVGE
jgi:hypothetical protein